MVWASGAELLKGALGDPLGASAVDLEVILVF